MNRPQLPGRTEVPLWLGVLVVTALWLLARPYVGLRHDGVIYLGQALRHLDPEVMAQDLFFAFGSQDSFTLFGRMLAAIYARWNLAEVQILALALCQATMLALVFRLLRPLGSSLERWMALAAIAAMSHVYGGFGLLSFGERFVTARTPAEPLLLASLVLLLESRLLSALVIAWVAAVLHPLMTLPVLVVAWLVLCQTDRRWWFAGLLVLLLPALALLQIKPFDGLLLRYDDAWWVPVSQANAMVFLLQWQREDWQVVAFDLFVLALAARWLPPQLGRLCIATAVATLLLFMVSLVGADGMRNVLITQLQVWRVMWLTHVLALALLPALLWQAWSRAPGGRLFAVALATALVAVNGRWPVGWAFMAWAALTLAMLLRQIRLSEAFARMALGVSLVALVGLSVVIALSNAGKLAAAAGVPLAALDVPNWSLALFTAPLLAMAAATAALVAWQYRRAAGVAAGVLVALGTVYGLATWDRRTEWTRFVENGLHDVHPFTTHIPRDAQVYWQESGAGPWMVVKRASYLSAEQWAGILFSRATALEATRRQRVIGGLRLQAQICQTLAALNRDAQQDSGGGGGDGDGECWPTIELVEDICRTPAGPDFFIFERRLAKGLVAEWTFEANGVKGRTLYLYDCSQLR